MKFDTKTLSSLISDQKIVLIGENHGVIENPQFVQSFVSELINTKKIKFVGFEYPKFIYEDFLNAAADNKFERIENLEVTKMLEKDGRFSKEHFKLLVYLHERSIPFTFFDSGRGTWDDRDLSMYENITEKMQGNGDSEIAVVIAGNIHTTLRELVLNNKTYKPLGTYFDPKKILLIELKYHSGAFFNFERRTFENTPMPKFQVEKINENTIFFHLKNVRATK